MDGSGRGSPGAVVRALYDAMGRGDVEQARRCVAEDFVWHEPLDHPWSGEHPGFAGLMAINEAAATASGGTLALDVHDVVSSDDHAVVLQTVTATVHKEPVDLVEVVVAHAQDGALTEAWVFYRDPDAARRLFAAAPPPP